MASPPLQILLVLAACASTACITRAGGGLDEIETKPGALAPHLQQTVGAFAFETGEELERLVTSNKLGRHFNDEILGRWKEWGLVEDHDYVPLGEFSPDANYRLTLAGHAMSVSDPEVAFLSGLTLYVIPHIVETDVEVRYTLWRADRGCRFDAAASDNYESIVGLVFLPLMALAESGVDTTFDRLAGHLHAQLVDQGAFDEAPICVPEPEPALERIERDCARAEKGLAYVVDRVECRTLAR